MTPKCCQSLITLLSLVSNGGPVWIIKYEQFYVPAGYLYVVVQVHVIRVKAGKTHWKEYTLFAVGLVIFLTTLLQAVFALLRPPLPHQEETKETKKTLGLRKGEQGRKH